jgi:uroporphyrinogen-III decarboxylase
MYRCPDKLLAAQEKLIDFAIGFAIMAAQASGNPRIFIPLHRGADGFMSIKQFEEFYWPNLKKMILALVDAGCAPMPFFEGDYAQRLEYLRELPGGKVLCWFDRTDMFKAKEVLGDKLCIAGGMPVSILGSGSVEQVKTLTKQLIDGPGKGGGYIMTANTVLDEAEPELVKAWMDTTKEYGVYE